MDKVDGMYLLKAPDLCRVYRVRPHGTSLSLHIDTRLKFEAPRHRYDTRATPRPCGVITT